MLSVRYILQIVNKHALNVRMFSNVINMREYYVVTA